MKFPKYEPTTDTRFEQRREHAAKDAFWTAKAEELFGAEPAFQRFSKIANALFFIPAILAAIGLTYLLWDQVSGIKICLIPLVPFAILVPMHQRYYANYCRSRILKDPVALAKVR